MFSNYLIFPTYLDNFGQQTTIVPIIFFNYLFIEFYWLKYQTSYYSIN